MNIKRATSRLPSESTAAYSMQAKLTGSFEGIKTQLLFTHSFPVDSGYSYTRSSILMYTNQFKFLVFRQQFV
jgi:hypothetical protein